MTTKALITGITGQDGSYLADLLLAKGYEVHGIVRRSSSFGTGRLQHIYQDPHATSRRLFLHYGDLTDANCLDRLVQSIQPDEVYNLAAQSHVRVSFDQPVYTAIASGSSAKHRWSGWPTREMATYSCPWVKHSPITPTRSTPTTLDSKGGCSARSPTCC